MDFVGIVGYFGGMPADDAMDELEAELRQSQFSKWDAEKYLAERHRRKIERLEGSSGKWPARWQVTKEISNELFALLGKVTAITMAGLWLLTGSLLP